MVIQFVELDELLAELPKGHVVRVEVLHIIEGVSKEGISQVGIGVHVRAFAPDDSNHVLVCYICMARRMQSGNIVLSGPGSNGKKSADKKVMEVMEQVRTYLAKRQFDVRPGVIEIGDARLLDGGWKGLKSGNS